jgi:predicted dinucleotide-binding enzyme
LRNQVLAVPWAAVASAVSGVDWGGRTVVDGTNPLLFPDLVSGGRMQQFGGPLAGYNLLQGAT